MEILLSGGTKMWNKQKNAITCIQIREQPSLAAHYLQGCLELHT